MALFAAIPEFIQHLDPKVSIIGVVSLVIMLGWAKVKHFALRQIPAPLLVLIFAIPTGIAMHLATEGPSYTLLKVGNIVDQVGFNADFSGVSQMGIFIKYVIMVALVGSLESLLTVKAIDLMDPYKRKSDPNKDIIAVGVANTFAAFLGGLPMISEVARSSANVIQGAKTRWANFFHGIFLLVFALLAYPLLEKIPNAALAAMLIVVGINLTHPKHFIHAYKIGAEQLAIFVTTIFFTLFEDLLVGIAAGIVLKIVIHVFRGASLKSLFKAATTVTTDGDEVHVELGETALFTNYLGIKKTLNTIPDGKQVFIKLPNTKLIDHSVMENLHHYETDYFMTGGQVHFVGLDLLTPLSDHPLSARVRNGKYAAHQKGMKAALAEDVGHFDEAHVLHELKHYLPSQMALKDFVHHNSLHAFQDKEFFEAIFSASKIFGIQVTFNIDEYRQLYKQGRIKPEILERVIVENKGKGQINNFLQKMLEQPYQHTYEQRVGQLRAQWKKEYQFDLDNRVQPFLFRIIGSYLDQGIALWHFPFEDQGLMSAVRTLEQNSYTSFFKSKRVRKLALSEDLSLEKLLKIVVGKKAYFEQYIYDQQFAHKGWSGIIGAIEDNPGTLLYKKEISLKDFIMLELLLEIDALDRAFGTNWEPIATNVDAAPQHYFTKIQSTELDEVLKLWQLAFEWDYYDGVLSAVGHLAKKKRLEKPEEKSFQAMFCIDDRECSIRRHIEQADLNCETLGAPGFFGAAFYFQPFNGKFYEKQAPAPAQPIHLIKEIDVKDKRGHEVMHSKHSHTFFRGFMASLSLGLWASVRLVLDIFRPKMNADIADAFSHMNIDGRLLIENTDPGQIENGLQVGYTVPEMTKVVEGLLRGIGLVDHFAPLVYVVAHGSSSANNPHHGAHDCGACSGRPGAVNARVFAFMANHPEVRSALKAKGLRIPDKTQFVGGMHDTASDEMAFYDTHILSKENAVKHKANVEVFETALDQNAKERARRFASIDIKKDIKHVRNEIKKRSVSYFEPRPELGHGTNALCYVGARERMKGLFLDRRAFLNSYDYRTDPDGTYLQQVMAPLPVVCGGINLEYYFSRMDIEKMGAGTKLPHNVMGLIGVANSSDGDLRPGLPLQMVENHDPVRLLLMVEQRPEIVLKVISTSPGMYDWFDKGWVHLAAVSPEDGNVYYFENGKFSLYHPVSEVKHAHDILNVIETAEEMKSNHILDATKENIPVHLY
ncbi:MAG: putative inorganic carbon transporter subunit DabA [Saprospiraceae bacterium]